jgi:hypothetical protein
VIHGGVTSINQMPPCCQPAVLAMVVRAAAHNLAVQNRYRIFCEYQMCFVGDASFRNRILQ